MTKIIRDRIVDYLQQHPEGVDDGTIAGDLQVSHQQANSRCRQLEAMGAVERRKVDGTIHNFLVDPTKVQPSRRRRTPPEEQPWHWEGHVQQQVVEYLELQGFTVLQAVDTASREPGKDIIAEHDGQRLWITVKGYPRGTVRTRASTQARHWFRGALFDILQYRGESAETDLGVALPDFPRYHALAGKITWFQPVARFTYFWVREDGTVSVETYDE